MHKKSKANQENVHIEQDKLLMIPQADAIADPGTVVIHADDTTFALAAMMSPWGFNRYTGTTSL